MSSMEIELPPQIVDSFKLPDLDDDILISPALVDKKLENYMKFQTQTTQTSLTFQNIQIVMPSSSGITDPTVVNSKQLEDIILTQIVQHIQPDQTVDETVDTGMKMCAHLFRNCEGNKRDDCGFREVLSYILSQSWVPKSAAQSLSGYVHDYLHGKENLKWSSIKEIFEFVMDEKTTVLVYLVVCNYVTLMCAPKSENIHSTYIGYFINDLNKYIHNSINATVVVARTSAIKWPGIIIQSGDDDTHNLIDVMGLSEWFIIDLLVLQTGYLGFKIGEKIWKLLHSVIRVCNKESKVTSKNIQKIIELQSTKIFST